MSARDAYGDFEVPEEKEVIDIPNKGLSLDEVLEKMHSDENRLEFLRKIYTPENPETGMKILALTNYGDSDILESEVKYAFKNGPVHRFERLAKILFDRYMDWYGFDSYAKTVRVIKKWKNQNMAEYAVKKLESKEEYECTAEISRYFGKKGEMIKQLEKLLEKQLHEKDITSRRNHQIADTYTKLKKYDEAIDFYIKAHSSHLKDALKIAKRHRKKRIKTIAETIFESFIKQTKRITVDNLFSIQDTALLFVECSELLGKEEGAKKTLMDFITESDNLFFSRIDNIIKALIKLGLKKEAQILKKREHAIMHPKSYILLDDKEAAKEKYLKIIDDAIKYRDDLSPLIHVVEEAHIRTQDPIFLEKKMEIYESRQKYSKAAKTAEELGKHDLAQAYKRMMEMIKEKRRKK